MWDEGKDEYEAILGHKGTITKVAVASDGCFAGSASKDGTVRLWSLSSYKCVEVFEVTPDWDFDFCISQDMKFIITGSEKAEVWEMKLQNNTWKKQQFKPSYTFNCNTSVDVVAIDAGANRVAACNTSGGVYAFNIQTKQTTKKLQPGLTKPRVGLGYMVAFAEDGQNVVGSNGLRITVWTVNAGSWGYTSLHTLNLDFCARSIQLTGHGETLRCYVCGNSDDMETKNRGKAVVVGSSSTGWPIVPDALMHKHTFEGHQGGVRCVIVGEDGKTVVSGSDDMTVRKFVLARTGGDV